MRPAFAPGYWPSLAKVSVLFAVAMSIQQIAYLGTSVTNASFLVNTATVMTPLAAWLLFGDRPTTVIALAAGATLLGVMLMSGGLSAGLTQGDLAALVSAMCYALWMVELGRHMQTHGDAVAAATAQFLGAAAVALPLGLAYGHLSLTAAADAGPELLVLGVFSTAVAFGIQTISQRFTSASHAAVIVSAESVVRRGRRRLVPRRAAVDGRGGGSRHGARRHRAAGAVQPRSRRGQTRSRRVMFQAA